MTSWRRSAIQYLRVATLTIAGVITFEAALAAAWRYGPSFADLPFSNWFLTLLGFFAVCFLLFVAAEPIRIRAGHWALIHRYPPLWASIALTLVSVVAIDGWFPNRTVVQAPDWVDLYSVTFVAVSLLVALVGRQLPFHRKAPLKKLRPSAEITWGEIHRWIQSGDRAIEPDELDFFGHRELAARIAETLVNDEQPRAVALVGPLGSGKTGIINAVRALLLENTQRRVIVAELNAWSIAEAKDAPWLAIERIIHALDGVVDTQKCRGLPGTYHRLALAEPSGLLEKFVGSPDKGDPVDLVSKLDALLLTIDTTVVLVIEDAERAGDGFETRHLQRLLWALGRSQRVTFVLAYSEL